MKKLWLFTMLILIGVAMQAQADLLVVDVHLSDSDTNPQWVTPSDWATEKAWLKNLLGFDVYYYGKDEDNIWNDGVWNEGNPSLDWTYAVLKYGVGTPSVSNPDHWAILDDGDHIVDFGEIEGLPTLGNLSHITYFGTTPAPVPEPATIFLLSVGLAGLAGLRKKIKKV